MTDIMFLKIVLVLVGFLAGVVFPLWALYTSCKIKKLENDVFQLQLDSTARGMPVGDAAVEASFREFLKLTNPEGLQMYEEFLKKHMKEG